MTEPTAFFIVVVAGFFIVVMTAAALITWTRLTYPLRVSLGSHLVALTILQLTPKSYTNEGAKTTLFEDDFDEVAYANSERSRVTISCVLRYADKHKPEIIVVENVVEVTLWGPGRDGSTFAWWKRTLENRLRVECLFLNSQFFPPCPESRDRNYIVCWKKVTEDQTSITDLSPTVGVLLITDDND